MKETFEEKELKILRDSVDLVTDKLGRKLVQSKSIKTIIQTLEDFLRKNKTLCYGGTAVNNLLPEKDKFYNKNIEIPDYDFFSPYAKELAKKLADIYHNLGYDEVEAKSGVHVGTYKVYVNFMPIADITYLEKNLFDTLYKNSIKINAINYCPSNFLRMAMYQELSRPEGQTSRWEKVLKRLTLLNKNYPLKGFSCDKIRFQRQYEGNNNDAYKIYSIIRKSIIDQELVFFGGYALSLYGKYMPRNEKNKIDNIPDFDVICEDPVLSSRIIKEQLKFYGYKNIIIDKKPPVSEYVSEHYEIKVKCSSKIDTVCMLYKANSCYSYNVIYVNKDKIKVATIDTILYFYLIFMYADRPYYDINRLLCMSEFLFKVQLRNRLEQKGLLRRFSITCYGKQETMEDIRAEKMELFKSFKEKGIKKGSDLYERNFLRYVPSKNETKKELNNSQSDFVEETTKKPIRKSRQNLTKKPTQKPTRKPTKKPTQKLNKLFKFNKKPYFLR